MNRKNEILKIILKACVKLLIKICTYYEIWNRALDYGSPSKSDKRPITVNCRKH